jgi:acetoin utilization deacetylase AcuC-like enzyme
MHCDSNYPTYKARSTYDVPLPDKMGDDDYMEVLIESVERAIAETNPDFVLYDAGVDVHKDDFLGRLALTDQGIRRRDRWVIDKCVESKIPIVGVIGGGYDKDPIILAKRHAIVHEEAAFVWRKRKMWNLQ